MLITQLRQRSSLMALTEHNMDSKEFMYNWDVYLHQNVVHADFQVSKPVLPRLPMDVRNAEGGDSVVTANCSYESHAHTAIALFVTLVACHLEGYPIGCLSWSFSYSRPDCGAYADKVRRGRGGAIRSPHEVAPSWYFNF